MKHSYLDNFSVEWSIHTKTQLDSYNGTTESRETLVAKTGFDLSQVRGKTVLDVGCGVGRFSEVLAGHGAIVTGVDLSESVIAARENLRNYPSAAVVQVDIMSLTPDFGKFDYVFSIGVLHHTPNTEQAFKVLPKLVKPGGELAVWVYSDEGIMWKIYNRISNLYRRATTRLPLKLLYMLCYGSIPLYYLKKIPILGKVLVILLPSSQHSNWRWTVLDTFDWYSPKYQWKHTYQEVEQWFRDAGMVDIKALSIPVSVRGRKPC